MALILLLLSLIVVFFRGRYLFGAHLRPNESNQHCLEYRFYIKKKIDILHLGIVRKHGIPFNMVRERWYHRILKIFGRVQEFKLPNSENGRYYFLATDFPDVFNQALQSEELMHGLESLFRMGVKGLYSSSGKIWCTLEKTMFDRSESELDRCYEILEGIANKTVLFSRPDASANIRIYALLAVCAHAGLLTFGILGCVSILFDKITIYDLYHWKTSSVTGAVWAISLWFWGLSSLFRNTAWICWILPDFLLVGVVGFSLMSVYLVRNVDIYFPQAPAKIFEQKVLDKVCSLECDYRTSGRGRVHYHSSYPVTNEQCMVETRQATKAYYKDFDWICISSAVFSLSVNVPKWDGNGVYRITTDSSVYDQIRIGDLYIIPIHKGALGIEWLDKSEFHPVYNE